MSIIKSVINAECHLWCVILLNVIILSVVMLSVVASLSLPFQAYPTKAFKPAKIYPLLNKLAHLSLLLA